MMCMPEAALTTAAPPWSSMPVTMRLVQMAKKRKVRCASLPQRTSIISRKVCMLGAFFLISMARIPKRRICTVAPAAYQKGPERPYLEATFDDWRRVAAHVHWETMT